MLLLACGILLLLGVPQEVSSGAACRISEFPCRNGKCVLLNGYCDGKDDCGDMSDEPMYCTDKIFKLIFKKTSSKWKDD
ncbi:hypothetical protein GWI33_005834 [Rhynchophorus ferrugineus]|uniref:Uncharacterized protein n=1 Tax=Rhynchophorus ferrugineus TaxID=354439 RepID=A0A834IMM9_RHYFE|nr:hypothetical protein GWI33_005834 [Rhynchophorus ferrugineus]